MAPRLWVSCNLSWWLVLEHRSMGVGRAFVHTLGSTLPGQHSIKERVYNISYVVKVLSCRRFYSWRLQSRNNRPLCPIFQLPLFAVANWWWGFGDDWEKCSLQKTSSHNTGILRNAYSQILGKKERCWHYFIDRRELLIKTCNRTATSSHLFHVYSTKWIAKLSRAFEESSLFYLFTFGTWRINFHSLLLWFHCVKSYSLKKNKHTILCCF